MKIDTDFEALSGLRIDTSKLRFALCELRTYSTTDVLWLLLHTASRLLAADHCATVKDFPLSSPAIKGLRYVSQQRERIEKAMKATIDGWLSGSTLPPVPCVSLGANTTTLNLKDKLMPVAGYYILSCSLNRRAVNVVIAGETRTLQPGGQTSVSAAESESVEAVGEGQVLRWKRQPSASPKTMPTNVLPLPKRVDTSHARGYALVALLAAVIAGAAFYYFYF